MAAHERLGEYGLLRLLGEGAYGSVYLARRLDGAPDGQPLALKVLKHGVSAEARLRFDAETKILSKLRHPGIVRLREHGIASGRAYYAMDYCPGKTLRDRLDLGPLRPSEAARLLAELARAVDYAHTCGVLHRDLKPANVILASGSGQPRITDFGLARDWSVLQLTRSGDALGTPYFMAPEQLAGNLDLDERCDVWALGVILYECLAGVRPFDGPSLLDVEARIQAGPPRPPSALYEGVPPGLDAICLAALVADREHRTPRAAALAEELEAWLERPPEEESPEPARPATAVIVAAVAVVLLAGLLAGYALAARLRSGPAGGAPAPGPGSPSPAGSPAASARTPTPPTSPAPPPGPSVSTGPAPGAVDPRLLGSGQRQWADGFVQRGPDWALARGLTLEELGRLVQELERERLRLVSLTCNPDGEELPRYAGVWRRGGGEAWTIKFEVGLPQLLEEQSRLAEQGYGPEWLVMNGATYGETRYTACWSTAAAGAQLHAGLGQQTLKQLIHGTASGSHHAGWLTARADGEAYGALGLILQPGPGDSLAVERIDYDKVEFLLQTLGGDPRWELQTLLPVRRGEPAATTLWTRTSSARGRLQYALWRVSDAEFLAALEAYRQEGIRPRYLAEEGPAGDRRLIAIWDEAEPGPVTVAAGVGHDLDPATLREVDAAVSPFLASDGPVRLGLAVARRGQLVLARGYVQGGEVLAPTPPDARFRLARLSSLLTTLAVLHEVQEGRLSLTDRLGQLMPRDVPPGSPVGQASVEELLAHESGLPSLVEAVEREVTVVNLGQVQLQLKPNVDRVLRQEHGLGRRLTTEVLLELLGKLSRFSAIGSFRYSDLGTLALGRALELSRKQPYVAAVRKGVLQPLEPHGFAPAGVRFSERRLREVLHRRGSPDLDVLDEGIVPQPYGGMDTLPSRPVYGWLGSAPDVARLVAALEDPDQPLLERGMVDFMWRARPSGVAVGWQVLPSSEGPVLAFRALGMSSTCLVERLPGSDGLVLVMLADQDLQTLSKTRLAALRAAVRRLFPAD